MGTQEGGDGFLKLKICLKNLQRQLELQGEEYNQASGQEQGVPLGPEMWFVCVWTVAVQGSVPKTLSRAPQAFPRALLCSERWMPLAKMHALMLDHFGSDIFGALWQYKSLLPPPAMTVLS